MNSTRVAGYFLAGVYALCLVASLRVDQPTVLSVGAAIVGGVALEEVLRRRHAGTISARGVIVLYAASPGTWTLLWGMLRLHGIFVVMFGGMLIGTLGSAIRYRPQAPVARATPSPVLAERMAQYNRLRNRTALRVAIGFALVGAVEWLVGIKMVWIPENWVAALGLPVLLGLVYWVWGQLREAAKSANLICPSCHCNVAKWGRRLVLRGVCPQCGTPLGAE